MGVMCTLSSAGLEGASEHPWLQARPQARRSWRGWRAGPGEDAWRPGLLDSGESYEGRHSAREPLCRCVGGRGVGTHSVSWKTLGLGQKS